MILIRVSPRMAGDENNPLSVFLPFVLNGIPGRNHLSACRGSSGSCSIFAGGSQHKSSSKGATP